jgi:CheY-like chemotaxis protein
MSATRTVLALLGPRSPHASVLGRVCEGCGCSLEIASDPEAAAAPLGATTTRAVLVDGEAAGAEKLCQMARVERFPGDIVVLLGTRKPDDAAFARAYDWGADDVVSLDSEVALGSRLGRLPTETALPPRARGTALVAEPDAKRAARVERMLGYAGYDVACATGLEQLEQRCRRMGLVLLSSELGSPPALIHRIRQAGSGAIVLVWTRSDEVERLTRELERFERVIVLSQGAPVESVLFLSNQLISGSGDLAARTERRFLYGTTLAFREAGAEEDDYGYTYNVGPQGIYVRTLAVPETERLWVELCPPGERRRVRLAGEVVWRRHFGFTSDAVAPPGFGLRLSAGLWKDYERWLENLGRSQISVHAVTPSGVVRSGLPMADEGAPPRSSPPDSKGADSERWFSSYVEPPLPQGDWDSRASPPRRGRGSSWAWILFAAIPVLLVGGVTFYIYARAHPGRLGSSGPNNVAGDRPVLAPASDPIPRAVSASSAGNDVVATRGRPEALPTTAPSLDTASLPPSEGYLTVASSASASVYVNGRLYGPANQPLRVPCGLRFVRLGEPPGPRWVGPGRTVDVACQGTTESASDPRTRRDPASP